MNKNQTRVTVTYYLPLSAQTDERDTWQEKSYMVETDIAGLSSILGAMDGAEGQGEDDGDENADED